MKRWDLMDEGLEPTDNGSWVLFRDIEHLLKRLAELEAKEQKRERFDRESA